MMEQARLNQLLNKYQQNSLSEAEKQELDDWFHQLHYQSKKAEEWLTNAGTPEGMFSDFQNRLAHLQKNRRIVKMQRIAAAAMLLIVSVVGVYYFKGHESIQHIAKVQKQQVKDILPGSNKATLTLGDGQRIDLTDAGNKHIASDGGAQITKSADGQLLYRSSITEMPDPALNTVSTPVGGQYRLTLADGTKVWLNASSSITYPTIFNGDSRQVKITGEAYFEVAHNAEMPFRVISNGQQVEVLGTHFNINAYTDESATVTTLLQGSVKVSADANTRVLKPGQQALLAVAGHNDIKVTNADTDAAVAWKEGYFQFNQADVYQVMRQLGRWYDIKVIYKNQSSARKFQGAIQRDLRFSQVLRILEKSNMHFTVAGKEVTVMD